MVSEPTASSIFPRTDWSQLGSDTTADAEGLDRLIRLYWNPLKVYLLATFPNLSGQAELLLQDFAEDKILKRGWLQMADRSRGHFRDFLKISLRNFVLDRLSRVEHRNPPVPLDDLVEELPHAETSEEVFDLNWARTVLSETLRRMEMDCRDPQADQPRRTFIWEMFCVRLLEPLFNDARQVPYDELVQRFKLQSPTDASNLLLSGKRIFKSHLNRVIKDYAGQDAATQTEIRELEDFLSRMARRDS